MANFIDRLRALAGDERGQDLIEYALLFSLIAIALIGGLTDASGEMVRIWDNISANIAQVP